MFRGQRCGVGVVCLPHPPTHPPQLRKRRLYLVSLEIGPAAGGEALLAAEALHLAPHAQGVALDADLLAPGAHDLHAGRVFVWKQSIRQWRRVKGARLSGLEFNADAPQIFGGGSRQLTSPSAGTENSGSLA